MPVLRYYQIINADFYLFIHVGKIYSTKNWKIWPLLEKSHQLGQTPARFVAPVRNTTTMA